VDGCRLIGYRSGACENVPRDPEEGRAERGDSVGRFFVSFQEDPELMEFRDPKGDGHVPLADSLMDAVSSYVEDRSDDLEEVAAEVEHHDPGRDYLTLYAIEHDADSEGGGGVVDGPAEFRIKFERSYQLRYPEPVKPRVGEAEKPAPAGRAAKVRS
jgi:hypothetical protein